MSVPVIIDLPKGYRRIDWPGRLGRVAVVVGGPRQPRGAALLVPGYTGSKEDYFALLEPLAELGWAVAAVDLPGMAESDGPAEAEHYGLSPIAGDVVQMLRLWSQHTSGVHLVGHSVGGLIAREAALQAPGAVASLTLYDSGPAQVGQQAQADASLLAAALASHSPGQVQVLKESMDAAAGRPAPPPHIAAFLRRRWDATSVGHLLALGQIARTAPDRLDALAGLIAGKPLPAMVLYGEREEVWPLSDFPELAARLGAREVVIPDAGHSPAVENPDAMVAALDAFWHCAP